MESLQLAYTDRQSFSINKFRMYPFSSRKLIITSEGGHGKSAKLKDFVASRGILPRFQAGHSIVDNSSGANASIVYGI